MVWMILIACITSGSTALNCPEGFTMNEDGLCLEDSADTTLTNDISGSWSGVCEFSAYDMDVLLDLKQASGGNIVGTTNVEFTYYGYTFDLDGDVDGLLEPDDRVELDLDFGKNGSMDIFGELTGEDEITGSCESGGVEADITLTR